MRSKGPRILLIGAAAALLVGVVAYLVETDEEALERIVEECSDALLAGDAERILGHLAEGAEGGGWIDSGPLAPEQVRERVMRVSERLARLSVSRRVLEVEEDAARGEWLATARWKSGEGIRPFLAAVKVRFRRDPSGWRIVRVSVGRP